MATINDWGKKDDDKFQMLLEHMLPSPRRWPEALYVSHEDAIRCDQYIDARDLGGVIAAVDHYRKSQLYGRLVFAPLLWRLDGRLSDRLSCLWCTIPTNRGPWELLKEFPAKQSAVLESSEVVVPIWIISPAVVIEKGGAPTPARAQAEGLLQRLAGRLRGSLGYRGRIRLDEATLPIPGSWHGPMNKHKSRDDLVRIPEIFTTRMYTMADLEEAVRPS